MIQILYEGYIASRELFGIITMFWDFVANLSHD
jgi:hypothetical protein